MSFDSEYYDRDRFRSTADIDREEGRYMRAHDEPAEIDQPTRAEVERDEQ